MDAIAAAGFDIQPLRVKARLLTHMLQQNLPGGEQLSAMCEACTRFAEDAAAQDKADDALEVLEAAQSARRVGSPRTGGQSLRAGGSRPHTQRDGQCGPHEESRGGGKRSRCRQSPQAAIAERVKSIQQTVRQLQAIQAVREKLKTSPDDPVACLAIGRWRCFHDGAWSDGLKFLAKGSDRALKSLAADDMASQAARDRPARLRGDAWWDAADKAAGDDKPGMLRRAKYWYSEALPGLTGLLQAKVEKRLDVLAKEAAPPPSANVDPAARHGARQDL